MQLFEIVCVTPGGVEREAAIEAVAPFVDTAEVEIRVYRHESHLADLAVHLVYPAEISDHAGAIGDRIADLLESHGLLSRVHWREVRVRERRL